MNVTLPSTMQKIGVVERNIQSVLLLAANHEVQNWDRDLEGKHLVALCR